MGYQVLARKYRPQRFADVAGQDHVTRTLLNALSQGRIAHGYIFSGHRGIGKTTIARILAQALNCRNAVGSAERPTPEPCGVCDSCVEVRQGSAVDVIEIDAATNRGIDEIRELRDAARYSPARDRYKIYILDEAHQITEAAFNALLKTLEEPPSHVVFMMATTEPENIPQTIRSRCQHFSFHAVKFEDILTQLQMIAGQEQVRAEEAALALLAEAGDGSMRDALSIMDQAIASAPCEDGVPVLAAGQIRDLMGSVPNAVFERLMDAVAEGQGAPLMEQLNVLLNSGHSPLSLARQLVRYLRNALMAKIGGEQTELLQISADERARAARTAVLFTEEDLTRNLQIILRTFDDLNFRQEQRLHLELGLLKLIHAQRLLPLEELLSGVAGAARSGSAATSNRPGPSPMRSGAGPSPGPIGTAAGPTPAPTVPRPVSPFSSSLASRPAVVPRDSGSGSKRRETGLAVTEMGSPARIGEVPGPKAAVRDVPAGSAFDSDPGPMISGRAVGYQEAVVPAFVPPVSMPVPAVSFATDSMTVQEPLAPVTTIDVPLEAEPSREGPVAPAPGRPELVFMPAAATAPVAPAEPEAVPILEPVVEETAKSVPAAGDVEEETVPVPPEQPTPEASPASDGGRVEAMRQAVVSALANSGHASASQLLGTAAWKADGNNLRIEVPGIGKKMLSLTVNAVAEKIIRQEIQRLGGPARFLVVPGEGLAASTAPAATPMAGSIEEAALANPLVQRAKEMFKAEVRSVVDLRTK